MENNNGYEQFKGQSRLPKFAIPKRYDLKLKPDLIACTFTGTVEINLEIFSDTKFLVLNASQLEFDHSSIYFTNPNTKEYRKLDVNLLEEDEILVLGFDEDLPIGEGSLYIGFKGILNDQMKGFYRSTYEHNGEKKNMAVTQFEPADARRCFPCWDEPAFKATFKITLDVPEDLMALSNMPIIEDHSDGNLKTVSFQESPIMSTYLVAVVVGLFDYVEDHTPDGIKVRVYCQVGKGNQGKFALDVAVKTLGLYREYFDTPYSLPKLDMVAIPDFAAGAMENYGLVTYRETALLYDDQHSAAANKQRVAVVVAHELAHQWFGNLVTMEWWTHLWLNEGFATWVSYLAADILFPEWNIWTQFLDETTGGLTLDGLTESHPIEVEIQHANEIDEIFDAISYEKGASVIRMLQSFLGPECFQRSLASYIKLYACSNAKTEDLWAVLERESGEPVNKLMYSWTKQQGYPVISVNVRGNKLEFEQSQFMLSGVHGNGQWIVPISLCCGSYDVRKNFLLQTKSDAVDIMEFLGASNAANNTVEKGNHQKWIKLNVDQAGFYRVKYDEELAARLRYAIEANHLSATDRFGNVTVQFDLKASVMNRKLTVILIFSGILDDSFALSMGCKQSLSSLFILMSAYKTEHEYTVLSNLITVSRKVAKIAADASPDLLDFIKQFFINLFQYSAERLGWEPHKNESHLDAMLRGEVLTALALFGDDNTQSEAIERFRSFLNDRNTPLLPPDTRKAAYVAVMQSASKSNRWGYESLLRIYRETDLSQEKTRVLSSLTSCPDADIVLEALNFLLSSEVRSQDAVYGLGVSREGREIAWRWLKDKWDHILKTFGSGYLLTDFVSTVVSPFSSKDKAAEVEEFFASRANPSIARTLKQSLERVHINANWVKSVQEEKQLAEVVKVLANKKG
ncbi:Aminopeptidase [Thalictrum thalictroides]|uniref:Aminopeptidase n=1 Tax=Thalictrum thalictroides TaxID=46969 RepID=A0A7J6VNM4_THATH|nr:Aminopeptidase [Thalictrum thalictroides]